MANPLVACPPNPPIPINTLNGLEGDVCMSIGDESMFNDIKLIPIYLQGSDSVGGRAMTFKVTRFPSHGTLYLNNGTGGALSMGIPVDFSTVIHNITGTAPNLVYVGNNDYFNMIERLTTFFPAVFLNVDHPYENNEGTGIDGCALQATTCPCTNTSSPGCPDTFDYKVLAGSGTSVNGTYSVHVRSRPSNFAMVAPNQITYITGQRFMFTGEATIRIMDPDDDAYMVSVVLNANPGTFGLSDPILADPDFNFVSGSNCLNNGCSGEIEFWTTVTKANRALAALYFNYAGTWKPENTLLISVYKPQPNGTNAENAVFPTKIRNSILNAQLKIGVTTPPGTVPSQGHGLDIAIIAGASAAGCLALIAFIIASVRFMRASRKAAKATGKSLASHHSNRQFQQLAVLADAETGMKGVALDEHHQSTVPYATEVPVAKPPTDRKGPGAPNQERLTPQAEHDNYDTMLAWEMHQNGKTGEVYYYNPMTGVTQWDAPKLKLKKPGVSQVPAHASASIESDTRPSDGKQ